LKGNSKLNAGRNAINVDVRTSNIVLGGKVYSEGGNYNLTIDATGDVVIANDIGSAPGVDRSIGATVDNNGLINELRVIAGNEINLLADITTKNLQEYSAISTNIGSVAGTSLHNQLNWGLTGVNNYQTLSEGYVKENNPDLVRTLISVDPTIRFKGAVNDTIESTHSLIALSISRSRNQNADIIFESTVGAERKLYSLTARTLEYLEGAPSPTVKGTIMLGGNVSTTANQLYSTTRLEATDVSVVVGGNATVTGDGALGTLAVGGSYTQTGDVTATSITVGGVIRLNGEIRTINDQIWTNNNQIILKGDSKLIAGRDSSNAVTIKSNTEEDENKGGDIVLGGKVYSEGSDIVLGGKVYSEGGNYNLTIDATRDIVIANDIGSSGEVREITANVDYAGMINELRVIAGRYIELLADITTKNLQEYSAISTNIGSVAGTSLHNKLNWRLTGANNYQTPGEGYMKENKPDLVRTLISVDPTIRFNGAVNDTVEGTHSLVTLSIARVRNMPADVIFKSTVGKDLKLYSLSVRTLEYIDAPVRGIGTIALGGSVSTVANQTYSTTLFEVIGDSAIVLSSESGTIRIQTPAYKMTVGMSLDYSFSKPPEVSSGPGLIRLADILRDVPANDFTAGSLSNKLMRMAVPSDISSDGVDAEVSVGDLESSDEGLDCKPGDPRVSCAADSRI
jgi:hypothetical protein